MFPKVSQTRGRAPHPPSAGLTRQSTALFLPDMGGQCRLACNLLTVLGFPYGKAGSRPSSEGSTEPQPEPLQRALPCPRGLACQWAKGLTAMEKPGEQTESPTQGSRPGTQTGLWPTQLSGESFPHQAMASGHTPPRAPL